MAWMDNLVAGYRLDEVSGTAFDVLGVSDLTDNNTVGSAAGKIGNARDFERDNQESLSIADNAALSMGDIAMSIIGWVRPEIVNQTLVYLCKGTDVTSTSTLEYAFYYSATNNAYVWRVRGGSTNTELRATVHGAASAGVWDHFYVEHDPVGNTIGISIDGGTLQTASHTAGIADGTGGFAFGWDGNTARYFDGLGDETYFFKKRLSAEERAAHRNAGNGLAYPWLERPELVNGGLVGYSVLFDGGLISA